MILAETLAHSVIVVADRWARPILLTLDTKVVVGLDRQATVAVVRFEDTLRKCNAGRNTILLLVLDRNLAPTCDVLLGGIFHTALRRHARPDRQRNNGQKQCTKINLHSAKSMTAKIQR